MQIKEIVKNLGISEGTVDKLIKRPEAERLLWPTKNEYGYYDYSSREIRWLKRYRLLRIAELKYDDFLAIEHGKRTLAEVLTERLEFQRSKQEKAGKSIEFCQKLLDAGDDYESLPVEELFDEFCKPNGSTEPLDYDEFEDTHPISLERVFFCPFCGKRMIVDLADYVYNEYSNEEPMGQEIVYEYATEDLLSCPSCGRALQISGYTSEYPIGGFNYESISLTAKVGG